VRVLMVCLGNICRSPTAEGVFRARAQARGIDDIVVDSAGTGSWHQGEPPDPRTVKAARARGIKLSALRARQLTDDDLVSFDLVLAMDKTNLQDIESRKGDLAHAAPSALFLSFAPELGVDEVPDPYYGGREGFETVLDLCEAASDAVLDAIEAGKLARRAR
jgi:protein-tyrosine phosphatase